jgi:hypothetical protein
VVGSSVVVMATSPDSTTRMGGDRGAHHGRPVLGGASAAAEALAGCEPSRVWALSDAEVAAAMRTLGALSVSVDAHLVAVLAEAKRRSLGSGEGWGPVDWAAAMAPLLPVRDLRDLDAVATEMACDDLRLGGVLDAVAAGTAGTEGPDADPGRGEVLPVGKAAQVVRFHHAVRGLADPDQLAEVTGVLLASARGVDGLPEKGLAAAVRHAGQVMRPDRLVEHDADIRRAHRSLVKGPGPLGLSRYTLILDQEGAAIIDAAVDALATPRPDADTGAHDPRTPGARRADALLDLVTRAVGAPEGVPRQAKTSLVVTIGLDVLQRRCRGAGLTMAGEILTTDTVRRMACDAQLIPAVLGTHAEILDQGMGRRLFDRAQTRHLWLRDRHCTFPGCSKPAAWTDAHHLVHWLDHGPTNLTNAALLCRAHHTVVHRERHAGTVLAGPHGPYVHWDLTHGSYDTHLAHLRTTNTPTPTGPTTTATTTAAATPQNATAHHTGRGQAHLADRDSPAGEATDPGLPRP